MNIKVMNITEIDFVHGQPEGNVELTESIITDFREMLKGLENLYKRGYRLSTHPFADYKTRRGNEPLKYRLEYVRPEESPDDNSTPVDPNLSMEITSRSIKELDLSVRTFNCLTNAQIQTVEELSKKTEAELLRIKSFGWKSLNELKEILAELGIELRKV